MQIVCMYLTCLTSSHYPRLDFGGHASWILHFFEHEFRGTFNMRFRSAFWVVPEKTSACYEIIHKTGIVHVDVRIAFYGEWEVCDAGPTFYHHLILFCSASCVFRFARFRHWNLASSSLSSYMITINMYCVHWELKRAIRVICNNMCSKRTLFEVTIT